MCLNVVGNFRPRLKNRDLALDDPHCVHHQPIFYVSLLADFLAACHFHFVLFFAVEQTGRVEHAYADHGGNEDCQQVFVHAFFFKGGNGTA